MPEWLDRFVSFVLGVAFLALWIFFDFFKSYAGEPGAYVTSVWFYLVWSIFFLGGSAYLFCSALHELRSPRHHVHHHHVPNHPPRHGPH